MVEVTYAKQEGSVLVKQSSSATGQKQGAAARAVVSIMKFHTREVVVIAVTASGLVALADQISTGVGRLYRYALTPHGLAAVVVASAILSAASLAVTLLLIRKS